MLLDTEALRCGSLALLFHSKMVSASLNGPDWVLHEFPILRGFLQVSPTTKKSTIVCKLVSVILSDPSQLVYAQIIMQLLRVCMCQPKASAGSVMSSTSSWSSDERYSPVWPKETTRQAPHPMASTSSWAASNKHEVAVQEAEPLAQGHQNWKKQFHLVGSTNQASLMSESKMAHILTTLGLHD